MKWHKYSPEEIEFLRINIPGRTHRDLTQMFNDRFGLDLSVTQVTAACKNRKYNNGLNGCFPKGNIPFNKGMKGLQMGGKETQFKKGHLPQNYMPVGSERINPYGNVDVKIADPNKWRSKAALTWEAAHGPVPPGHVVIVADGNKQNVVLENLVLVSRGQLVQMNKSHLIGGSRELTEVGRLVADIKMTIHSKEKRKEGSQ